jgi:hypothetical protein
VSIVKSQQKEEKKEEEMIFPSQVWSIHCVCVCVYTLHTPTKNKIKKASGVYRREWLMYTQPAVAGG